METPKSLMDAWTLSEEVEGFSAETLLSTIMLKGMSFEPIFTDPRFYYIMNEQWWNKWKPVFDKWFIACEKEYEPLWDRNGYETVHEDTYDEGTLDTATTGNEVVDRDTTGSKNTREVVDDDTTYSKSGTSQEVVDDDTTGSSSTTNSSTTTNTVSAFDSNTYQPHDKSDVSGSSSTTTSGTDDKTTDVTWSESGSGTDDKTTVGTEGTTGTEDVTTNTSGSVDTDTTNDRDFDRDYHSWGNWGISQTSQKLLKSEYEVRYWNLYEHMADIFVDEMTIGVF
jgi:hypothetical protein